MTFHFNSNVQRLKCSECPRNKPPQHFFSLEEYEIHLANVHFDLNMFECANCIHAKFPTETTLITHFRQQHRSDINIKITYFLNPERIRKRQQIRQILNKCAFELKGQSQNNDFSQEKQQEATPEAEEEEVVELSDGVGEDPDPENLSSPCISRTLKTEIMTSNSSTGSIEPNGMSTPKSQRKMPSPSKFQRRRLVRKSRRISQNQALSNLSAVDSADCSFTWMDNSETTHRSCSPPVLDKQPSMSEEQISRCQSFTGSERIVVDDDNSPERPTASASLFRNTALANTAQLMQSILFESHVPNNISSGLGSAFQPVKSQLPQDQESSKYIVDIAPHQLQANSALTESNHAVTAFKKGNAKLSKARTPYQMFFADMINIIKKKAKESGVTNAKVARKLWEEQKDKSTWINKSAAEKVRFEQGYLSIQ